MENLRFSNLQLEIEKLMFLNENRNFGSKFRTTKFKQFTAKLRGMVDPQSFAVANVDSNGGKIGSNR